jgi:hypothetical protein
MPYQEKPPSKRARIAWLIGAWVVFIGPFTVLFFFWGGLWLGLPALALALWLTYDYLKRGDMFGPADAMMSGEGRIFGRYVEHRERQDR